MDGHEPLSITNNCSAKGIRVVFTMADGFLFMSHLRFLLDDSSSSVLCKLVLLRDTGLSGCIKRSKNHSSQAFGLWAFFLFLGRGDDIMNPILWKIDQFAIPHNRK